VETAGKSPIIFGLSAAKTLVVAAAATTVVVAGTTRVVDM
jgi:hypothetical protein